MAIKKVSLKLTGIIIQDPEERGYTGYFVEFPEAIADGITEDEVKDNMFEALKIMLETRKRIESENSPIGFKTQDFELKLA